MRSARLDATDGAPALHHARTSPSWVDIMSDPLSWWSIGLGRWAGTRVRIHLFLLLFIGLRLLEAAVLPASRGHAHPVLETVVWLGLMLLALVVHELGHAAWAARLGQTPDEVRLWPLGSLVGPTTATGARTQEAVLVALGGPLASGAMALIALIGLQIGHARMELNPFSPRGGAPLMTGGLEALPFSVVWLIGWFGYLNWVLFLANLIPALPMDGGRVLRGVLASQSRDSTFAPYVGRTSAAVLGLWGLLWLPTGRPGGLTLIGLALLLEIMVRVELRLFEDVGYFEEGGVFGYDFSQGYTSLESAAPTVRPRPESALERWRRRRSDQRRQRRESREAAEDIRLDEILDKLHREGRSALTDEEQRFLVRQSERVRSRRVQSDRP